MPNTIAQFDDELQTIAGTLTDATDLTAGGRRLLNRAADQVTATEARVNPMAAVPARGLTSTAAGLCRPPLAGVGGAPPAHRGGCAGGVGRLRSGRGS
jgi:hypothetical protein